MFTTIRRKQEPLPAGPIEIIAPRTNEDTLTAAESAFARSPSRGWLSFEIAADNQRNRFLLRAETPHSLESVRGACLSAWPQAELRDVTTEDDPALPREGEGIAGVCLHLSEPEYLPIRTFNSEASGARSSGSDPIPHLLAVLSALPDGWRAVAQLVVRGFLVRWGNKYVELANPRLEPPRQTENSGLSDMIPFMLGLFALVLGLKAYLWYREGEILKIYLMAAGVLGGLLLLVFLLHTLFRKQMPPDARLVSEKISSPGCVAALRLLVYAPDSVPYKEIERSALEIARAYQMYTHGMGNSLIPKYLSNRHLHPYRLGKLPVMGALNTHELAGLWHLPAEPERAPLLAQTASRTPSFLPETLSVGCPIGKTEYMGREIEVRLSDELLSTNVLVSGKTRRGKSSLLLNIIRHLAMDERTLLIVDPHSDLALASPEHVPSWRSRDVVFLDAAQSARPFGLNLLDAGLWGDRDTAVSNALLIFKYQFGSAWGKRMEDIFLAVLHTLYAANETLCERDPGGRDRQYTVLDGSDLISNPTFRENVLGLVRDSELVNWWRGYFRTLTPQQQKEYANPVQSKIHQFAAHTATRLILGQPRSTIAPLSWLDDAAVVIANTEEGTIGEDAASLIGATLINLMALLISGRNGNHTNPRVSIIADEFHTMAGANYERILTGLAKRGANLILATQSLMRVAAMDRAQGRGLLTTIFASLDGVFVFNSSADDSEYVVRELGSGLDCEDLVSLGTYRCYARVSWRGQRLPVFSVHLTPPTVGDMELAREIVSHSAQTYGRDCSAVERSRQLALGRIEQARKGVIEVEPGQQLRETAREGAQQVVDNEEGGPRARTRGKKRRSGTHGATMFNGTGSSPGTSDESETGSKS